MGNCLEICFGRKQRRKDYFRGRYHNCNVGIEFENLMDDDGCQEDGNAIITHEERELLNDLRYTELVAAQRKIDTEIDEKLQRQEEEIKLEEEAFIAAKREASRIARQKKLMDAKRMENSNGRAQSWLGDDESQWDVAGGQDDFEMFLESVKARSLSVRANGVPLTPTEFEDKLEYTNSKKDTTISSDDASWEGNFVNADMTPEPIVIPASVSVDNHISHEITTASTMTVGMAQTSLRPLDSGKDTLQIVADINIPASSNQSAKTVAPTTSHSVLDSSLKDFDDFLDELEQELDLSTS
ncbi:AP-1 complex-associated regulatory protein-like [Anneissia japonica]|uniref:AP-1 complex-associated regulatory protein-like n=1 Tax=Anneissia japonica TaxID=1529436 RepID=UPI0014258C83|nr:AP-1 complex-associated regulatory protein-like [Anneissia japonica]